MITFVTWKWDVPGYERRFTMAQVDILQAMIARHYKKPHVFVCIADESPGLEARRPHGQDKFYQIWSMPPAVRPFADIVSPHGARFPSCYRRLWNFSLEAQKLGERIVAIDIDAIITGDITDLFDRTEDFVGWTDARGSWGGKVAGGLYMLRTGSKAHVWNDFDPIDSPKLVTHAGLSGSDQGWMSFCLYPPDGQFTVQDGVYSIKWLEPGKPLPLNCKIVSTPGKLKPWHDELQKKHPWIKRHWRM